MGKIETNRIRVTNPESDWRGTKYLINGRRVDNVKAVDFRVAVGEVPTFTFETYGLPDIDMAGDVNFKFTPQTVQEAAAIIRHEFEKGSDLYNAAVESATAATKEVMGGDPLEKYAEQIATAVVDRIFGTE